MVKEANHITPCATSGNAKSTAGMTSAENLERRCSASNVAQLAIATKRAHRMTRRNTNMTASVGVQAQG